MNTEDTEVRFHMLRPREIEQALANRSVVYIPLGMLEWHGKHLPVGLDGLTAEQICIQAAMQDGGLVLPTLYYATGGEHSLYPWTISIPEAELTKLLDKTLSRLNDFGVKTAILFSGHFAGEQIKVLQGLEKLHSDRSGGISVRALSVTLPNDVDLNPDHAALFETTLLAAICPERIKLSELPPLGNSEPDPQGTEMGAQRHSVDHELYGIFGPDPRNFDVTQSSKLLESLVESLLKEVEFAEIKASVRC